MQTRFTPSGPQLVDDRRGERRWVRSPGETWLRLAPAVSDPPSIRASRAVGAPVFDAAGRRIARVAELGLEEASGGVVFVLLAFGGFLGVGRRFFRTSWTRLIYTPRRRGFVLAPDGVRDVSSAAR